MKKSNQSIIVEHYEKCFETHGANHLGLDWPNSEDVQKRYTIISDALRSTDVSTLLDFGCGLGGYYSHLKNSSIQGVTYTGLELSEKMYYYCSEKYPDTTFYGHDVLEQGWQMPNFDATVLNGVFTVKHSLSYEQMLTLFENILTIVYDHTKKLIIFNVMSKQVDWERDDLFHLPLDALAWILKEKFSRKFVIRNDYGLYEYMVYLYK